jgi:hypothetical protein
VTLQIRQQGRAQWYTLYPSYSGGKDQEGPVLDQPGQSKTPSQQTSQVWCYTPVITAT